ncbi:MAG: TRAP transporter small permease [Reyranella sp.]|uniref:TRAP transporter small permease subunit n=1 Tax=Reyranella sp. TaxID=1929291 RepID=UPI001211CA24|nr:TRAP transporter small permease [Reyranella sp.]TAJ97686.1 MAG: TRAP transporter small permease [Reyranella sp.]TBR22298.1 MAG: TRAP transporter small permease [Reyranella sp.]
MSESSSLLPPEPWPQRISRILAWIGGAIILIGCSGLITIDVITRFLFKRGMVESFEVSGYALAACIGLGLGFATTSKTHIRVDILLDAFPRPVRVAFDLLAALSLALLAVALAWFCWGTVAQSMAMNAKSVSTLQTPMALPQSIWWVGIFWFACVAVLLPVQAALRLLAGDGPGFDSLIGSLRVAEEITQAGVEQVPPANGSPR